jgi:arabinogalactan oligomer/maltooligosaccharide transport system substrate-binding protein
MGIVGRALHRGNQVRIEWRKLMDGFRKFGTLAAVAGIAIAACSSGGASPAATSGGGASQAPASQAPASQAGGSPSAAASGGLSGSITIWEAYGASGSAEKDTFDKMVANVKAANPGLTVTVLDVPFADLFKKFEAAAGAGGGPDLYIAPNDSLPKEARAGLLKDVSSLEATLKAAPYNTSQVAIDAAKVDGKLYEIPESMKAVELFYNTSLLSSPPVTTDDWMKNAKQLGWVYGANGGGAYYLWGLYSTVGG